MEKFSIGRDASNQIVLSDNFVSRLHAQLIISDNGQVMIKDLGSSNGTFVNNRRINECYLKEGDIVKCASAILNWQQYISGSPVKTNEPVLTGKQIATKSPELGQVAGHRNIISDSLSSSPQSINETFAAQNQPQPNRLLNNQELGNAVPAQQNVIVVGKAKSVGTAFILAFFFGPLGLLYASVTGGIVMFILTIPICIFTAFIGIFFIYPICVIWAIIAANHANSLLQNKAGGLINNNFQI
jgi:hypothetical protein